MKMQYTQLDTVVKTLREWSRGPMSHNPENADACNDLEAAAKMIEQLRDLVRHCWVHSGYRNCGRGQMGSELGKIYDDVVSSAIWDGS